MNDRDLVVRAPAAARDPHAIAREMRRVADFAPALARSVAVAVPS